MEYHVDKETESDNLSGKNVENSFFYLQVLLSHNQNPNIETHLDILP